MALDDELRGFTDDFNDTPAVRREWLVGTVVSVVPNGAVGGAQPLVTVDVRGSQQQMTCNRDVTYTAGDLVLVLIRNASPVVVCRLGNFPPDS